MHYILCINNKLNITTDNVSIQAARGTSINLLRFKHRNHQTSVCRFRKVEGLPNVINSRYLNLISAVKRAAA